LNVATVTESKPLHNGEKTWQAEVYVAQGGAMNHSGQQRSMCIRGPSRTDQDKAESDAKALSEAAKEGAKEARAVANQLQRVKKGNT